MSRPLPTKPLIDDLTGKNFFLAEAVHHGLHETPLDGLYPYLNLDEVLAFEAASWAARAKRLPSNRPIRDRFQRPPWGCEGSYSSFSEFARASMLYLVFNALNHIGFPWLNTYKKIAPRRQALYRALNPYRGGLEARLARAPRYATEKLREQLQQPVTEYVFEGPYYRNPRAIKGDNIVVMTFQTVWPKSYEAHADRYDREIHRILRQYPTEDPPEPPLEPEQLPLLVAPKRIRDLG